MYKSLSFLILSVVITAPFAFGGSPKSDADILFFNENGVRVHITGYAASDLFTKMGDLPDKVETVYPDMTNRYSKSGTVACTHWNKDSTYECSVDSALSPKAN